MFRKSDTNHTLRRSQTDLDRNCSLIGCHFVQGVLRIRTYINVTDALRRLPIPVVASKAYGLYLGAREHPSSAVLDRGSKHRTGATVSSRMAQSRCGSAGELLAWRPDRVGHEAHMGTTQGVAPGLWQGSAACRYNEDSDAIRESASKKTTLKWHYSRPL